VRQRDKRKTDTHTHTLTHTQERARERERETQCVLQSDFYTCSFFFIKGSRMRVGTYVIYQALTGISAKFKLGLLTTAPRGEILPLRGVIPVRFGVRWRLERASRT